MSNNMIQFVNHDQLRRCLLLLWLSDVPACIIGGVGCGKTMAVESLVRELNERDEFKDQGFKLWKLFLGLIDATEVGGIPYRDLDNGILYYAPPSTMPYNSEESGIIFGDEYDRAPPDVQNAFNQILLGREIHGNRISKNAYVVLAMNGESDRYTTPLSEAAITRVCTLFLSAHATGNLEQWDIWAKANNINKVVRAFAHCRPELIETHEDFTEQALMTGRSRDAASRILDACEKVKFRTDDILIPCLNGVIGAAGANELVQFMKMKDELPDIEGMLRAPEKFKGHAVFCKVDLTYMLAIAVAAHIESHRELAGNAVKLMQHAPPEIQIWAIKGIVENCPQAAATAEYRQFFKDTKDLMV